MSCTSIATLAALGEKLTKDDPSPHVDPTSDRSFVGSLMYLTKIRPYVMYDVRLISEFMQDPDESHW